MSAWDLTKLAADVQETLPVEVTTCTLENGSREYPAIEIHPRVSLLDRALAATVTVSFTDDRVVIGIHRPGSDEHHMSRLKAGHSMDAVLALLHSIFVDEAS